MTPQLQATLAKLPTKPGVYLLKDDRGRVLYVGKAQSLRNRVRQYWQTEPRLAGSRCASNRRSIAWRTSSTRWSTASARRCSWRRR